MNAQPEILTGTEISTGRRKPSELVAEYDAKVAAIPHALDAFCTAQREIERAFTVGGTYSGLTLNTGHIDCRDMERSLLRSAWRHCYGLYGLSDIASAEDKRRIERMFEDPPPFTVEKIREAFGAYIADPWGSILRGLAEVFSGLDPAFKSHEKMKVGVKGLPKRVILSNVAGYGSWGRDKLRDILNALAAYQGKPLVTYREVAELFDDGDCLIKAGAFEGGKRSALREEHPARGVWLRTFANGNGHLFFGPETLRDVNRALAEYYGEVLPDCPDDDDRPQKARASTAVAKDLQYYPTPATVVERVLADLPGLNGAHVLEPSCGCGRFLDAIRAAGGVPFGIEVDPGRAASCRERGHNVLTANFLDTVPDPRFPTVVMNPPFYGRHYAKHVRHALKWLTPGGRLISILPATARYDHGELDDLSPRWSDLPTGSFTESGTNIATTVATIRRAA